MQNFDFITVQPWESDWCLREVGLFGVLQRISVQFFVMETLLWTVAFARLCCCSYSEIEIQHVNAMKVKNIVKVMKWLIPILPLSSGFKLLYSYPCAPFVLLYDVFWARLNFHHSLECIPVGGVGPPFPQQQLKIEPNFDLHLHRSKCCDHYTVVGLRFVVYVWTVVVVFVWPCALCSSMMYNCLLLCYS